MQHIRHFFARPSVHLIAVFIVLWGTVIAYQWATGAYLDEFYYEDTATHFVSGVMVADYARKGLGTNPLTFAEQYYLRSPKVAFGRWPPLFHFLQGAVYLVFGASKMSALALVASAAAAICTVLFQRLKQLYGAIIAAMGVLVFAGFTDVRHHSRLIMSDLLTVLFCTLAVYAVADFINSRRSRDLVLAATWTLFALLTKETAVHLLIFAPAAFIVVDGRRNLRDWRILAIIGSMLAFGGGLLAIRLQSGLGIHGYTNVAQILQTIMQRNDHLAVLAAFFAVAPTCVFVFAACGWVVSERWPVSREVRVLIRLCAAWVVAMPALFLVSPAPPISRYFMPALVPLTILMAQALFAMRERFATHSTMAWLLPAAATALALLSAPLPAAPGVRGFASVAKVIPKEPELVTLISSESFGEGAFIAERLMVDRQQEGIVLRGSKVLSTSDWLGTDYRLLKNSVADVFAYLCDIPVHYVVLDGYRLDDRRRSPHHDLLQRTIEEHPDDFRPVGLFPMIRGDVRHDDAIVVYENVLARGRRPLSVDVELGHALGRTLRLKIMPVAK